MWKYIIVIAPLVLTSCIATNPTSCPAWGSCSNEDIKKNQYKINKINYYEKII